MNKILIYINFIVLTSGLWSCKTINMFQSNNHLSPQELVEKQDTATYFSPGDKVTLSVWQHNDLSIGSVFNIYNSNESFGKWVTVDKDSTVILPAIGEFDVAYKTTHQLEDTIKTILENQIVNPIVVVKVLNREVTILGEVRTPGNFILDKENTSIIEAIGKAEGFVGHADITKVQLIRNGQSYIIDMSTVSTPLVSQILVRPGDIIHIPSLKGKRLDQKAPTIIPFASAATSVAVLISLILR